MKYILIDAIGWGEGLSIGRGVEGVWGNILYTRRRKRLSYEATGTWIRAIIEGNTLTATLQPNDSPHERRVEVYFTVGNTGGSVTFVQPASH